MQKPSPCASITPSCAEGRLCCTPTGRCRMPVAWRLYYYMITNHATIIVRRPLPSIRARVFAGGAGSRAIARWRTSPRVYQWHSGRAPASVRCFKRQNRMQGHRCLLLGDRATTQRAGLLPARSLQQSLRLRQAQAGVLGGSGKRRQPGHLVP